MNLPYNIRSIVFGMVNILIAGVLISCNITNRSNTQTSFTPEFYSTQITPTQTHLPATSINQPVTTITKSITQTFFPTSTLTPSIYPTSTYLPVLPTLSKEDAEVLIKKLLLNNADCKLPCWWGITPGVSTWNETNQFLKTFTSVLGPVTHEVDYEQTLRYQINFLVDKKELSFGLGTVDEVVSDFGIPPETSIYGHKLNQVLSDAGRPNEIWLAPMPYTPGGSWYYLVLYYPEQGIMARYGGSATPTIEIDNEGNAYISRLKICPIGTGPELWLAPPNTFKGVKGNYALGGDAFTDILIPIQDSTNMNISDFYNIFSEGNTSTCFETVIKP